MVGVCPAPSLPSLQQTPLHSAHSAAQPHSAQGSIIYRFLPHPEVRGREGPFVLCRSVHIHPGQVCAHTGSRCP